MSIRVVLSGRGLRDEMSGTPGNLRYTFTDEPHVARAAWSFLTHAPAEAWIIAAEQLSDEDTHALEMSQKKGIPVTPVLLFRRLDPVTVKRSWELARIGVKPTFNHGEALAAATRLSRCGHGLGEYVIGKVGIGEKTIEQLILLLARVPESTLESAGIIAGRLKISRASLFRSFAAAGSPRLEDLQILFRLIRATTMLQGGASLDNTSYSVGFSDVSSLRKAYSRKLGTTSAEARDRPGYTWIVDEWMTRATGESKPPAARSLAYLRS